MDINLQSNEIVSIGFLLSWAILPSNLIYYIYAERFLALILYAKICCFGWISFFALYRYTLLMESTVSLLGVLNWLNFNLLPRKHTIFSSNSQKKHFFKLNIQFDLKVERFFFQLSDIQGQNFVHVHDEKCKYVFHCNKLENEWIGRCCCEHIVIYWETVKLFYAFHLYDCEYLSLLFHSQFSLFSSK